MILLAFIVPVITILILLLFFRKKTIWWECLIVLFPSLIGSGIIVWGIETAKTSDTYYDSELIEKVVYEEEWNEYVHKICTRTVRHGKTTSVQVYDCSYVRYHPDYWYGVTKSGRTVRLTERDYKHYANLWHNEQFKDLDRRYHTIDGDMYYSIWNEHPTTAGIATTGHYYTNYIKGSKNLYSLKELPDSDKIGLYEYPGDSYNLWQGWVPKETTIRRLGWINSQKNSPRIHILVWKNHPSRDVIDKQRRYWEGGKKNEVTFLIGLDSNKHIAWIESFSWSKEPWLENRVKSMILPGQPFYPDKLLFEIDVARRKGYWKPRDFSEYSYLDIEFDLGDYIIVLILTIIINIGISYWVITNEFENP